MEEIQSPNKNQANQPVSTQNQASQTVAYQPKGRFIKKILKIGGIVTLIIGLLSLLFFIATRFFGIGQPEFVTINYWGTWEDLSVMQKIIADFEAQNPKIKVNYEKQDVEGLGRYVERLKTRIDKGTGPDIYSYHSSWLLQLNDYLSVFPEETVLATEIETDYYDAVKYDLVSNGGYYGVPLYIDTLALFTNSQILNNVSLQPPREWNDIVRVYNPRLLVKEDGKIVTSSIALGTYDNIEHAPDIMAMIFLQNGADLFDLYQANNNDSEGALVFYRSFARGNENTWNSTLDNSRTAFTKGTLAMYFGYARDIEYIKSQNPNLQFEIVEAPRLVDVKSTVASYWVEGVSSKSKQKDEAFTFIEYLSKKETLEKLYEEQVKLRKIGNPYPRKSMQNLLENNKELYPFVSQADNSRSTFFSSDTHDGDNGMITRMNGYLKEAINGLGESSSAGRAIEILAGRVSEVLNFYGK